MSASVPFLGAVLAGGEGRRFCGPKPEARVGGVPMVERAVSVLRQVVDDVVIVSARPLSSAPVPLVADRVSGAGPLGGLDAALRHARKRGLNGVLLLACDLPLLTPSLVRRVANDLGDARAAAPERRAGGIEPLCSAWRLDILDAVERRLGMEDRSLHALFRDVRGHVVPFASLGEGASVFLNVNTPDDRARAEASLHGLPPTVCVIGKKKSGKTTTVVGLVRELARRGYRVMTAKHGHRFEFDREGTDSYRHRHEGGAHRVVMAGPGQVAVMGGWGSASELPLDEIVARWLADADVVVAEGFKTSGAPKVEVFRKSEHERPLYGTDPGLDATYLAVLTDVPDFSAHVPVVDVDDSARFVFLTDLIVERLLDDVGAGVLEPPTGEAG